MQCQSRFLGRAVKGWHTYLKLHDLVKRVALREIRRYVLDEVGPPRWRREPVEDSHRAQIKDGLWDDSRFWT